MGHQSAGSLIGAILESMGYHMQAVILDALSDPLTNEVGGLIYLVGIILAIAATATQGRYKMGIWLLIGPPLFFAVIQPRQEIANAKWRFGLQDRNDGGDIGEQVATGMSATGVAGGAGQANVSTVFKRYVEMISVSTQHIVATIVEKRNKGDLWLQVSGELFSLMHTARIDDPYTLRLMHHALLGNCGEVISAAREVKDVLYRARENARREAIARTPEAQDAKNQNEPVHQKAVDDFEWKYTHKDVNVDLEAAKKIAMLRDGGDSLTQEQLALEAKKIKEDETFTCRDIWRYTLLAIEGYSENKVEEILRKGESLGVERRYMANLMTQLHGVKNEAPTVYHTPDDDGNGAADLSADQVQDLKRIISKYMFRNEMQDRSKGAWMSYFITRLEHRDFQVGLQSKDAFTEQAVVGAREWAEKERLIMAAGSIPYYQGLLLFVMGTFFPFFALVLLIPGKQGGFILWFTLWLWLKSWDIGFAVVLVLHDFLFAMLAVEKQGITDMFGQNEASESNRQIDFVYSTLSEMDPTFQLSTYYTIMAVCVLAIPPTSAQLILGSLRGGATLVSAGAEKMSEFFSGATLVGTQQIIVSQMKLQARDHKMARMNMYRRNVEAGQKAIAGVLDSRGGKAFPFNPQHYSPVRNYPNRTAGAVAGGPTADRAGHGITYQQARSRMNQFSRQYGSAEGFNKSHKPWGSSGGSELMDSMIQARTASRRTMGKAFVSNFMSLWEADKQTVAGHAHYDADIDHRAVEIYEYMVLMGAIFRPWSSFASESSNEEYNLQLRRFEFAQNMKKAELDTSREIYGSLLKIATMWAKASTADKGKKIETMDDINGLSAETKSMIRKDFSHYLVGANALSAAATRAAEKGLSYVVTDRVVKHVLGPRPGAIDPFFTDSAIADGENASQQVRAGLRIDSNVEEK